MDKGSVIVITEKAKYIEKGYRQLSSVNFYESTPEDLTGEVIHRVDL